MFKFVFGGLWKRISGGGSMPIPPQPTPGTFSIVYNGTPVVKGTDTIIKTN